MKFLFLGILLLTFTPNINSIGTPCVDKSWYARNIWVMKYYDNRLFVGCGNSSNSPPAPNAEPINVWTYRPDDGWQSEYIVDDEQIDKFLIIDGIFTIPGDDARESWAFGNWYTRGTDGWVKHRNIPNALHVYDIIDYEGVMMAALGTNDVNSIAISHDHGQTWEAQRVPITADRDKNYTDCAPQMIGNVDRVYGFFTIGDQLYANPDFLYSVTCTKPQGIRVSPLDDNSLYWNGSGFAPAKLDLFAGLKADRIVRQVVYHDQTIYIGAQSVTDHYWLPIGLFSIDDGLHASLLSPPTCGRPQDTSLNNDALYVLCNESAGDNWQVALEKTCDLTTWETIMTLTEPTFARSFAFSSDMSTVYFGLGADTAATAAAQNATGEVLESQMMSVLPCRSS